MIAAAERLMTEFEDVPLVVVGRALSEARETTTSWLGRPDPAAMYRLAAWHLRESRLTSA